MSISQWYTPFLNNTNKGCLCCNEDKPVVISQEDLQEPGKNLGQTAAQIWLLSRLFSFFVEPYAYNCPDVWKVFTTMLEITGICLSKKITINILRYLRGLIKEHLQLFKHFFMRTSHLNNIILSTYRHKF